MRNRLPVLLLSALCWLLLTAAKPMPELVVTTSERPWVLEDEFTADDTLHARRDQTVVLELESSGRGKSAIRKNSVRFLVEEAQTFSFCIPDDEPHIRRIKLKRNGGPTVMNGRRGGVCKPVALTPGSYSLDIFHDGRTLSLEGKKAFLHRPERRRYRRSQNLVGETFGGTLQELLVYPNFFALSGGTNSIGKMYPQALVPEDPLVLSASSEGVLDNNVWSFYDEASDAPQFTNSRPMLPWAPQADWRQLPFVVTFNPFILGVLQYPPWLMSLDTRDCPTNFNEKIAYFCLPAFILNDQGNGTYTMWADVLITTIYPWVSGQPGSPENEVPILISDISGDGTDPNHLVWDFTYIGYADASTMPALQEGEFAIYGECDFQGTAFFFDADVDFDLFAALERQEITPPYDNIYSIKLGPSTFLQMFKDGAFTTDVGADIDCASEAIRTDRITVFVDVLKFIAATSTCINCNLSGMDFSGDDFIGVDFSGAILTSANLTDTNLSNSKLTDANLDAITGNNGSSLSGTNFTGARLGCTSFKGSVLTDATFGDNILVMDQSCNVDLSGATLDFDAFDPMDWRFLDLSSTSMNDVPQTLSTAEQPLDLSGAILSHVTWLENRQLDSVNLGCYVSDPAAMTVCPVPSGTAVCATLNGLQLQQASLKKACLQNASLEGASLTSSNLDEADLSGAILIGATLDNAFMRNVSLSGADLSGASAANANFYTVSGGKADATDITAPGVDFTDAYLAGADFSGSTSNLQSTTWIGALLINADFSQADLSINTSGGVNTGVNTKFKGAYLHGALFDQAILDDVNFLSTYWDALGSGGGWNLLIPANNLDFRGYWKDTGLPECPPEVKYVSGNPPPMNATNASNTCPDGFKYPGGCDSVWGQPSQGINLAFFKSAAPPAFPQDAAATAENQCGTSMNPEDFCWITTNNPTLCSEN